MDEILKVSYEWAYRGAIKDLNGYLLACPQKVFKMISDKPLEIPGIFLNKFKTRLTEAFGESSAKYNFKHLKAADFKVSIKMHSIVDIPPLTLEEVKFIGEDFGVDDSLKWFLKFTGNHFSMSMCRNFKSGKLNEFIESMLATPATETIEGEEQLEVPTTEDWEGYRFY